MTLTTDMREEGRVPYFLWDRNVTVGELRAALADPRNPQRVHLLRALLREARPDEVWAFVSPQTVSSEWDQLVPGLGRRRAFWQWLLDKWRERGYIR